MEIKNISLTVNYFGQSPTVIAKGLTLTEGDILYQHFEDVDSYHLVQLHIGPTPEYWGEALLSDIHIAEILNNQ